jgi:hypothetical protein
MEVLKTKSWPDLGLELELFLSPHGIPSIRMSDTDTDKTFGVIQFSRLAMAESRFAEEVAEAEKNLYPESGPKMAGAVKEGGDMIKTGFSSERIDAEEKYAVALAASRRAESVSEEAYIFTYLYIRQRFNRKAMRDLQIQRI